MPSTSSRMGSNRSLTDVLYTTTGFAGPYKKGKKSPRKVARFMPKLTNKTKKPM